MTCRYRLWLRYEGSSFCGWQQQPNGTSVQELLKRALCVILRHQVHPIGAGRTDAGVHALRQCCHFDAEEPITHREKFLLSVNGLIPQQIRAFALEEVEEGFHARYSAKAKVYRYYLDLAAVSSPFTAAYSWHLPRRGFDRGLVREALFFLTGEHDFAAFANEAKRAMANPRGTIRNLYRIELSRGTMGPASEELDYLEFEGEGFLYKMVRNLVGFLVEIGYSKRSAEEIPSLLQGRSRSAASQAAPSQGLFLFDVKYDR